MTPYIAHHRYKGLDLFAKPVNIPYGSPIEAIKEGDNIILRYKGASVCYATSEVAFDHFARNDDGNGLLRGEITCSIKKTLEFHAGVDTSETWRQRWNLVWDSPICQKYKKQNIEDHWIWNYDFYNAPILVLNQIASLVGAKKGK